MRYLNVDTISFEDIYGKTYAVKDMREYPDYQTQQKLKIYKGDRIDEIATRPEYYGDEAENEAYKIFEHNADVILEAKFDLSKIKELDIPVR